MSVRRISPRLQKILHSLATRVPKVVLHRAEGIFLALNTSLTVFVREETDFDSSEEKGHMSELQNKNSWRRGDSEKSGKPPDLLRIKRPSTQQQTTLNNSSMEKNKKV